MYESVWKFGCLETHPNAGHQHALAKKTRNYPFESIAMMKNS
jgi:hypothetical protein